MTDLCGWRWSGTHVLGLGNLAVPSGEGRGEEQPVQPWYFVSGKMAAGVGALNVC